MTWTRDAAGDYVDWTQPPYSDGTGLVDFHLEGEERVLPAHVLRQRIDEYMRLQRREMRRARDACPDGTS